MDLKDLAYKFNVIAIGYDEKTRIIQTVAKEMGRKGIVELAKLTGQHVNEIEQYAALNRCFENANRRRRQRKHKKRITAGKLIEVEIQRKLKHWEG